MTNFIGAYRGWAIYYDSNADIQWKAIRLGVSMNAADYDAIIRKINRKSNETKGDCCVCL